MTSDEALVLAKGMAEVILTFGRETIEAILTGHAEDVLGRLLDENGLDGDDAAKVLTFVVYQLRYRYFQVGQKRALKLLRCYLDDRQKRQMRSRSTFEVVGSHGGIYRLAPWGTRIARTVAVNGRRYDSIVYCFHDPQQLMPPADEMLGAMLLIMADEPAFLAEANIREITRRGMEYDRPRRGVDVSLEVA